MQKLTRFNSFIHSFKFIRNMKMQTQTFILQSFIFVLVFIIIFCSQLINQSLMGNLIQSVIQQIDTRTNIKQLNIQSQFIKIQAHYPIDQGFKFLQSFNRLNQLDFEKQSFSLQQLQKCESQSASFQYYSTIPLFCYKLCKDSISNASNVSLINHINGYYSLLNSIFLPISLSEFQKTMFFTFLTDQEYFAILPPKIIPDSYAPSTRTWYQQQEQQILEKNKNDTLVISDIYQDFETKKYEFAITIGLTDQQNYKQGIFGIDQTLEHYKELLLYQDLNIVVVDLKGRMLLSNLIVEQTIDLSVQEKYIYEKNITGFDLDDWKEMIQEAIKQGSGMSECQTFGTRQFCRYNSLFQQDLIIIVMNIKGNFYLLVFQSLAHITVDLDYAKSLQNDIFHKFQEFLFYYLVAGFFLLVASLMIIPIFFKPFKNIQKIVQTQMASKYTIHYEHLFFQNRKKNNLSFFQESFNVFKQKLLDFTQSKSQDCYLFENFKYPISCKLITNDLAHFMKTQINMQTITNLPSQNTHPLTVFFDSSAITSQKSLKSNRQLSPKDVTFRVNFQNIQYDN